MIKDLIEQQNNSKNVLFARRLTVALNAMGVQPSPKVVANEFNMHFNSTIAKPHTVRKWLIGATKPKSEALLLLANWLNVDPKDLISNSKETLGNQNRLEIDFTDQEVISKYLAMTVKQKRTIRLLIDTIAVKE